MTDTSSASLSCRECSGDLPASAKTGRRYIYCPACRAARQRVSREEYKARQRAGVKPLATYTCQDCKGKFPRPHLGTIPIRCSECRPVNVRIRRKARREAEFAELRRRFQTEGRWAVCRDCATSIRCRRQKGAAPTRCEPCRVAWRNAKMKITRPWIRAGSCQDCGKPTDRASRQVPRERCLSCTTEQRDPATGKWLPKRRIRTDGHGPSWTRRRGPWDEQFTALDIFDRDRWTCGICHKSIDRRLRHPHKMAATLDHVIPVVEGGLDLRANVRAAHQSCNSSRNNRGGGEQLALIG